MGPNPLEKRPSAIATQSEPPNERRAFRAPSRYPCSLRPARRPTTRRRNARGPTWWSRRRSLQSAFASVVGKPAGERPVANAVAADSERTCGPQLVATSTSGHVPVVRATAVASPQPSGRRPNSGGPARIRGRYRVRERRATAERGRDRSGPVCRRVEGDGVGDDRRRARSHDRRPRAALAAVDGSADRPDEELGPILQERLRATGQDPPGSATQAEPFLARTPASAVAARRTPPHVVSARTSCPPNAGSATQALPLQE